MARVPPEERVPDVAWIFALWKAIHGGDPSLEDVAQSVIVAIAPVFAGAEGASPALTGVSVEEFERRMKPLGITVERIKPSKKAAAHAHQAVIPIRYIVRLPTGGVKGLSQNA